MGKIAHATFCCALLTWMLSTDRTQIPRSEDTFAAARLSQSETQQILDEVGRSAFDTPESWEKELRVRRVDIGKQPGLAVRGTDLLCGATGNCQTWLFRQTVDGWKSLFAQDEVVVVDGFRLGPTTTNGIMDLTVSANVSAGKSQSVLYKFDGKFYRAKHPDPKQGSSAANTTF